MLRINISKNARAAVQYFRNALVKEGNYFSYMKVAAFWMGITASRLGLWGKVKEEDFEALLQNRHPETGKTLTMKNPEGRRAGVEFCWNAPKSASLLHAITGDKDILESHRAAVAFAMQHIQKDMQTQATRDGQKFWDTTGNCLWANFEHYTARPIEKETEKGKIYIPDPHLHTHSMVPSVTWCEKTGKYKAIETGRLHRLANFYESLYHSVFSGEMVKRGYAIERVGRFWEVKGISKELRDRYSGRTIEIEQIAKNKGISSPQQRGQLGAKTRHSKQKGVADERLPQLWKDRLSKEELAGLFQIKGNLQQDPSDLSAPEALNRSIHHHLERSSAVPGKRIIGDALALGYGHLELPDIEKAIEDRKDLLTGEMQTIEYLTVKEMVALENEAITFASSTKSSFPPLNSKHKVTQEFLNKEQRGAILQILHSTDQVNLLSGRAGVGKTSLLTEVRIGIENAGKKLFGFAPSADASRRVMREKGFKDSNTVASLLASSEEIQKQMEGQVILIDEASMISTKDMVQVMRIAKNQDARLILSGDIYQHGSVGAGSILQQIQEKTALPVASVNTIVRQKNEPYRQAIQDIARGETLRAYNKLDKMGAVKEFEEDQDRYKALASDYLESLKHKRSALVVSPTHQEGEALTGIIREELKKEKYISGEERVFPVQRDLSLTEAEKKDPVQYDTDCLVQFHRNHKGGFKSGEKYFVEASKGSKEVWVRSPDSGESKPLPIDNPSGYKVFKKAELPLRQGDVVRITNNGKTMEGNRINNGQTFTVNGFSPEGDIQLQGARSIKTIPKDYGNLTHGYVVTSHASQGRDAQDVYLSQGSISAPATHEKSFYVSAIIVTERIEIYTDNKEELKKVITRSGETPTALEVAQKDRQRRIREQRVKQYQERVHKDHGPDKDYQNRLHENGKTME